MLLNFGVNTSLRKVGIVSEHMGWVRNVVLMNVYFGSGKPQGVGIPGGEGPDGQMRECKGQFTSNPREKWTDPVTARRVSSKWKRGTRGARGLSCT
jgi:hypothetical protein